MKKIKKNSQEVILTESKIIRDLFIRNEECFNVLDKIKAIPYLTNDMVVTVEQVADYYEVTKKSIETVILRNREELEEDGITVLKGEELKLFKQGMLHVHDKRSKAALNKTTSLTVLTKRIMLLIAFYLQNNKIAELVKSELFEYDGDVYKEFLNRTKNVSYIKRYENEFGNILEQLLGKNNKIKKQVKCGVYRIDFVLNKSIAIEVDEKGHCNYDKEKELVRHRYIENSGYKLYRFNPQKDNILKFLGDVIGMIN